MAASKPLSDRMAKSWPDQPKIGMIGGALDQDNEDPTLLQDQKMLRLHNPTQTLCYANAGTNFLLSAPEVTRFLSQQLPSRSTSNSPICSIMHQLAMARTDQVRSWAKC